MPREIKFRAWNKHKQQIEPIDGYDLYIANNDVYDVSVDNFSGFNKQCVTGKYEIMQYTGLNDINGKEIYEGDKLKGDYEYDFLVVVYSDKKAKFMLDYYEHPGAEPMRFEYELDDFTEHEVIGNIYEHQS